MTLVATLAEQILDAICYRPVGRRRAGEAPGPRASAVGEWGGAPAGGPGPSPADQRPRRQDRQRATGRVTHQTPEPGLLLEAAALTPGPLVLGRGGGNRITEDEVNEATRAHLTALGFDVAVTWGHLRGINVDPPAPPAAAATSSRPRPRSARTGRSRSTTFLAMVGELVQRMDVPHASYGIARPANRHYSGLVDRFPPRARGRLKLVVVWVSRQGDGLFVNVES